MTFQSISVLVCGAVNLLSLLAVTTQLLQLVKLGVLTCLQKKYKHHSQVVVKTLSELDSDLKS